jgi:hypothetical protein
VGERGVEANVRDERELRELRFGVGRARARERERTKEAHPRTMTSVVEIERERRSSRMSSSFCLFVFACVYL